MVVPKPRSSRAGASQVPSYEHSEGSGYYDLLPVKPGVEFLQCMLSHRPLEVATTLVPKLMKFPMADTFVFSDLGCVGLVYESDSLSMRLVENMSPEDVLLRFDLRDNKDPAGVRKRLIRGSENRTSTVAISVSNISTIVRASYDCEDFVCLQKFVKRVRPSADKPKFLRVCYRPSTKARIGYMVSHTRFPGSLGYRDDSMEALTRVFCVSSPEIACTKVSGKYLDGPAEMCAKIVYFMENYFHIRLTELVVDLIPGTQNMFFLTGIKSFSVAAAPIARLPSTHTTRAPTQRQLSCSVCRCAKAELSRTTTTKLLIESVSHLHARGVTLINEKKTLKNGGFVKCCDACYTMVMNEQELMRMDRVFKAVISKGASKSFSNTKGDHLTSWRLMMSFDRVLDWHVSEDYAGVGVRILDGEIRFARPGSFCVLRIDRNELDLMDQTMTVYVDEGTGQVERALDKLVSATRFGQEGYVAHFRVYLGRGKSSVEISIGLESSQRETDPLPDAWVNHLSRRA